MRRFTTRVMASRSNYAVRSLAPILGLVSAMLPGACNRAPGSVAAASHTATRPPMTIPLGERNENSEVQAHTGDLLEISLPENATTGYRWASLKCDLSIHKLRW